MCRVFKKKNYNRDYQVEMDQEEDDNQNYMKASGSYNHYNSQVVLDHQQKQNQHVQALYDHGIDGSMHLPRLFSPDSALATTSATPFISPPLSLNTMDLECSQNSLRLTSNPNSCGTRMFQQDRHHHQRFNGSDWSFLDKLLAYHSNNTTNQLDHYHQQQQTKSNPSSTQVVDHHHMGSSSNQIRFPFQYLGCDAADILKFSIK